MKTRLTLSIIAAASFAATTAWAWNLSPCTATDLSKRARYSSVLRHALPQDRAYVPKPFPQSDSQVVEDFNYQFRHLRSVQPPEQMRTEEKQLLGLLNSNQLETTVIPVENWTGRRCTGARDGDRMYLLRFFDATTHAEVGRATLQDSGLMDVTAYRESNVAPAWWTIPIPPANDVAKNVGALVGEHLINAQYVTTYGVFQCDALLPCVAMHSPSTDTTYIADQYGHLNVLRATAKRFSRARELAKIEDIERVKRTLKPGQKLMSLGGDAYAVIERVK